MPQTLFPYFLCSLPAFASKTTFHSDLLLFPPESRAATADLLAAVQYAVIGPAKSAAELGTIRRRILHCLQFFYDLGWFDDLLCEKMC